MSNYKFRSDDNIGNLDAESDSFLETCFIESKTYNALLSFEDNSDFTKRIIVGRTGSGKTALLKKIKHDKSIKKTGEIEAESTIFEHIENNIFISSLNKENIDLRVFYKSLWVHVLLVKIIETFDRTKIMDLILNPINSSKKRYNSEIAKSYIEDFEEGFFNDNIVSEITQKMHTDLQASIGFGVLGAKGKDTSENTKKIQSVTSRYVSSELLKKQKEIIKLIEDEFSDEEQVKIIIGIDDLDKSWLSSSSIRYDFINALLESFKELINIRSVKIIISIRTDIMMGIYNKNLRQEEKDKAFITPIKWSKKEIIEILDKRINHLIKHKYKSRQEVKIQDIFNFKVGEKTASDFIIERTMLRPRDAIDFINICLSNSDDIGEMNENIVLLSEEEFYTSRKQAIVKEWVSLYPKIKDYIDSLSFITEEKFSIENQNDIFESIQDFLINRSDKNETTIHNNIVSNTFELINVWFIIGLIGIEKNREIVIYSSFEKQELDITDRNKNFRIHPLFFRQ